MKLQERFSIHRETPDKKLGSISLHTIETQY
jgi:hypothetical protein